MLKKRKFLNMQLILEACALFMTMQITTSVDWFRITWKLKLWYSSQISHIHQMGAQWLSDRVLDSRPRGCGFESHRRHCVVVLEQDTFILQCSLVLVQPRNTRSSLTERLLMGLKDCWWDVKNQIKQTKLFTRFYFPVNFTKTMSPDLDMSLKVHLAVPFFKVYRVCPKCLLICIQSLDFKTSRH